MVPESDWGGEPRWREQRGGLSQALFSGDVESAGPVGGDVVEAVRRDVQAVIDRQGSFITAGDLAAFLCR
jgi:hypothetical protein